MTKTKRLGLEAWLPENGPKTEQEWFELEVGWCKTYLRGSYAVPNGYFSPGVVEVARKAIDSESVN